MPQRIIGFLVVLLLMFQCEIFGQEKGKVPGLIKADLQGLNDPFIAKKNSWQNSKYQKLFLSRQQDKDPMLVNSLPVCMLNVLPASFYTSKLGFFCKQEFQLEKNTSLAFRFRLGSLEYVNWLEQKPNSSKPPY